MPQSLDQLLPSLQSLGAWSYWILALITLLEAFVLSGLFVPGALAVVAGGILVQRGVVDFFDMAWFVGIGSSLGAIGSYYLGRLAARGLNKRAEAGGSRHGERAKRLLGKYGGFAMVVSRFLGPLSGFVSFSAAIAEMTPRRFMFWNIASALPYTFVLLSVGYYFGDALHVLGGNATRIAVFSLGVLVVLALLWFLVSRIRRALPFVLSLGASILRAVLENPDVVAWADRHPRTSAFLARRTDPARFGGLTASLLAALFVYILVLYIGTAIDVTFGGQIVQADERLATLLFAFRDERLIRFFAVVTAVGDKKTVIALLLGLSGALIAARHQRLLAGLWVSVLGNTATVALLKIAFGRPRPELGYFAETSNSFPSGHAAASVAFFALAFYVMWRAGWLSALVASLAGVTVAFLIGLSRVYLIEHYLSDVSGGFMVGAMWAIAGIALIEWQRTGGRGKPRATPRPALAFVIGVLAFGGASCSVVNYEKPLNPLPAQTTAGIARDIPALFASGRLPVQSETITGVTQEPISLVIVTRDTDSFRAAMKAAGWIEAERPGVNTLAQAAWAAWANQGDTTAPVTPTFWNGLPNDMSFQKPSAEQTLRKRHHARFWETDYRTPDGGRIFVGTASYDDGLKWGLTHRIAPNIDAERNRLAADLSATGVLGVESRFQMVSPRLGENFTGDPWFTDGQSVLLQQGATQ